MGRPQGQGHLRHTRVAEALDTGMVTGEVTITGPQIIQQSLISLIVVDLPDPVNTKVNKVNKEIIEIKEGEIVWVYHTDILLLFFKIKSCQ